MKEVSRAIILDSEGKVLLGKRSRGAGAGLYALIGGKPDVGETAETAVIREVYEEIGANFIPTFYLRKLDTNSDPTNPWMVTYFTGEITGGIKLDPSEVEEILFVTRDDLDKLEIAFDHRERLKEFFQRKK